MSVISATLQWRGQTAKRSSESPVEYVAIYHVLTNSASDGGQVVMDGFATLEGIDIGSPYEFGNDADPTATLKEMNPSRVDGTRVLWQLVCSFRGSEASKPEEKEDESGGTSNDPEEWRDEWEFSFSQKQIPVEDAKLIGLSKIPQPDKVGRRNKGVSEVPRNSAGVIFDPPLEKEDSILVMRRTSYHPSYSTLNAIKFQDAVNSDDIAITIAPYKLSIVILKGQAKVQNYGGSFSFTTIPKTATTPERVVGYWKRIVEIHIRRDGWYHRPIDRGFETDVGLTGKSAVTGEVISAADLPSTGTTLETLADFKGEPLRSPQLLDGRGGVLPAGEDPLTIFYMAYKELPLREILED